MLVENAETEELAPSAADTDGVYPVRAFTGLGAPHRDGRARAIREHWRVDRRFVSRHGREIERKHER